MVFFAILLKIAFIGAGGDNGQVGCGNGCDVGTVISKGFLDTDSKGFMIRL